jgi:hypothetical protein
MMVAYDRISSSDFHFTYKCMYMQNLYICCVMPYHVTLNKSLWRIIYGSNEEKLHVDKTFDQIIITNEEWFVYNV